MKNAVKSLIALSLVLLFVSGQLFSSVAYGQSAANVRGVVIDKGSSEPIIGATVLIKGTTVGSATSYDGSFEIRANDGDVLEVSYLGYSTVEVVANGSNIGTIELSSDAISMDEVVVVGYGTMKRSDVTGAITSVSSEELLASSPQSLEQALQGRAAGVQVSTVSAAPGGSSSIRIRGVNSLYADADPLYVIDGFPIDAEDLNSYNVNDFTSVEILKDASSTAIYGSRGANGVILITTSRGANAKTSFSYSGSVAFQEVYRSIDVLNGEQFATVYNEFLGYDYYADPSAIGEGTNWFDEITEMGLIQDHNLSIQGGTETNKYRVSAGYYGYDGVVINSSFNRFSFNAANDMKLNKWLDMKTNVMLSRSTTNGSSSSAILQATYANPVQAVYDEDGNYTEDNLPSGLNSDNPVSIVNERTNETVLDNVLANITLVASPIKDLSISVMVGSNVKNSQNHYYNPTTTQSGALVNGSASISNAKTNYWVNENVVNYKKSIGNKHSFDFTGGLSFEETSYENTTISASGFASDAMMYAGLAYADTYGTPTISKNRGQIMSTFARVSYNFDDRYIINVTDRVDGNSGFAEGNKWGNFPSVGFAWRLSEESFMENVSSDILSNLKLRLGWGITGNSNIGYYQSMSLLTTSGYVWDDTFVTGVVPNTVGNKDLKWEKTEMYNVGVDIAMFNNRLNLTLEGYYKYTSDMLMEYEIPSTTGYTSTLVNAGAVANSGFEISASGTIIDKGKFQLSMSGNFALNNDVVKKLVNDEPITVNAVGGGYLQYVKEGGGIADLSQKVAIGIFDSQEAINNYTWTNPETGETNMIQASAVPGDIMWADLNDDGAIDTVNDIEVYGSAFADYTYGINLNMKYGNWMLDVFTNGSEGNWVYNQMLNNLTDTNTLRNNLSTAVLDYWTTDNPDATYKCIAGTTRSITLEDASYFRIQTVKLTYNFPKKAIGPLNNLSIYASIDNLYVWTQYSGWDPDVNTNASSSNLTVGVDNNSYPRPRTYRIGLTTKF